MANVKFLHRGYVEPHIKQRTAVSKAPGPDIPNPFEYKWINEIVKTDFKENRIQARGFTGQIIDIKI